MNEQDPVEVLVVEDSPLAVQMVRHWLEDGLHSEFHLHAAGALAEGLQLLAQQNIDLVVLDLNLPDSEGLNTFDTMHAAAHGVPIVIMSAESDEELAITAVRRGAQDYVVKSSFHENPLARPVRYALERSGRERMEKELQRTQEQLFLARVVQQQMLQTEPPVIPGFDVAGRSDPADEAGGDYFDFMPMIGDKWGIVIGDVAGHGLKSALYMVCVRAVLRALKTIYGDVGFIVTRANQVLELDMRSESFVTMMFLSLDPKTRTTRFVSAGHPAHIFDSAGKLKKKLNSESIPLGIVAGAEYATSAPFVLTSGDMVLLYTDGVTETHDRSEEMFGEERLIKLVRAHFHLPATAIVDKIFEAARDFRAGQEQKDDITAVVLKCEEVR